MPNNSRRAIVVLGMHRSGTSAVAGTAVRLGAAGPRTPLDASADNPAGFYESERVVMQNHKMLKQAGCAWNLCLHRDAFEISNSAPAFSSAFARVLAEEFGNAPLFVLKDPRLCMTFPAWLPVLRTSGIDLSVMLVIRNPAEVAQSIKVRNHLPEPQSVAQWLHHVLESERATRGLKRTILFYDDVLANWRLSMLWAARAVGIAWPNAIQAVAPDVDRFLAEELRHQRAGTVDEVPIPRAIAPLVQTTWDLTRLMRDDPDHPDALRALDRVQADFAAWRRSNFPADLQVTW
jgi:hypothetical protein